MADNWVTIPETDWETIPEAPLPIRAGGAFVRGGIRMAGAIVDLPKHIVSQVKILPMANLANEVLAAKDPQIRAAKLKRMAEVDTFYNKMIHELGKAGELHRIGQEVIIRNHPEWESEPADSFVDLLTSPDKLIVSLAESAPLLISAGILTAAGAPQVGVMMMYASEGQEAYDRAKAAGESDEVADDAYLVYGIVAAALENMQLQNIMKIGRGAFNRVLNRTAQKVGRQGAKALTWDIIKVAAQEALEEATQGEWGDVTAKILYGEPFGPIGAHIDRRAQEALIGAAMGIIPGISGAAVGKAQRALAKPVTEVVEEPVPVVEKPEVVTEGKELWEMTKEEYKKLPKEQKLISYGREGKALTDAQLHYDETKKAVELGKPVPHQVLEEYKSEKWAQEALARPAVEIKPPTPDETIGKQYGLAPEETNERLGKAELRYRELKNKPVADRTNMEKKELTFLKRNRKNIEALLERETQPLRPKPKKVTRKQLLKQGHVLPKKLGMTEGARRQFMKALIGMTSMKRMTPEQMQTIIDAYKDEAIARGIEVDLIEPEEYGEPIVVNNRATTMEEVMDETIKVADDLPAKVNIPKHIYRRFHRKIRRSGLFRRLGRLFYGVDNSPLYELVSVLEQGKSGILTEVFDDNIQEGRAVTAGHKHSVSRMFEQFCKDNNITHQDLAKLSESCNARMFHGLLEAVGRGTSIHTIRINDRTYDMTPAELLDIYLIARQEDGLRHMHDGGLVINGVRTGEISEETLLKITGMTEANPQLMQLVDIISQVGEIWKDTINNVSLAIETREIATVENWWGLEVPIAKQLAGKQQKFNVNLIENKGILKDRTKADDPLIVRDALQRFTGFENAIAEYVGLAQPTRVARTLINDKDFNELLRSKGYSHIRENMHLILERTQSVFPTSGSFDRLLKRVVPGVYRAVLFFNPRVVMSQFTSVANYQAFVSAKYATLVRKGLSPEAIERTLEISDIAWDRFYMGHSSLELGELAASDATLRLLTKTSSDKNKLGITLRLSDIAALASGMEIATAEYKDARTGKITSESAIYWADKDVSFKEGSTDAERAIIKRAEWLWHRSQPSWDKWSRSAITSDPSSIKRLFFLFRSFHEKSLTILHGADTEYRNSSKTLEDKARFAKKYGAVLSGYSLNTILRAVIMAGLAHRIKDPFDYLKDLITAPFRMMPILGHILDGSIRSFLNALTKYRSEYRGEAIESLPLTIVNEIGRAPINFTQAAGYYIDGETEKANKSLKRAVAQLYMGVGTAMGVPVFELNRIYKGWLKPEKTLRQKFAP